MDQLTQSFIVGIFTGLAIAFAACVIFQVVSSLRSKPRKLDITISCDSTQFDESIRRAQNQLNNLSAVKKP